MKQSLLLAFGSCCFLNSLSASVYTTNFNSYVTGNVENQDGWNSNDTTDGYGRIINSNINYLQPSLVTRTLRFGDVSGLIAPVVSSVRLSNDYSGLIEKTDIEFDFLLQDSRSTTDFTNRDQFGFSLSNGNTDVFSLLFTPAVPVVSDPSLTTKDKWNVDYRIGMSPTNLPLNISFFEATRLHLDLSFAKNTGNATLTDVFLSIRWGSLATEVGTASALGLAIDPNVSVSDFNLLWTKQTATFGSNRILIDNLSVVPEPSSAILLSLAGLCLVTRRRRA